MPNSFRKIWRSTTENAIWIFYAINTLFTVTDHILFYMTIITVVGMFLYYVNAFLTGEASSDTTPRDSFAVVTHKLWRITEANSVWLACGISAVFYLEGQIFIYSLILTLLSFVLFYTHAYSTTEYAPINFASLPKFTWRSFGKNLWAITESNILTVAGTLSLLLFVTGQAFVHTAIIVFVGFILFYIDGYRAYLVPVADNNADEGSSAHVETSGEK